ncbi:MAG: hypothetical protein ACK5OW_00390 [bacterium]|jgi:hypothetical protein
MAIILPTYSQDYLPYRYADRIENNGLSEYNFFYSPVSKVFWFKNPKGTLTQVTIDLPTIDNLIEVNNNGQRTTN